MNVYNKLSVQIIQKFRIALLNASRDADIHPSFAEDLTYSLLSGLKISAMMKIQFFLKSLDLFPAEPNQIELDRLRWLNQVRNSLFHTGTIPKASKIIPEQAIFRLSLVSIFVQMDIVRVALAKKLELRTMELQSIVFEIKNFFIQGTYNGQRVFDETISEYLDRISLQWEEEGFL